MPHFNKRAEFILNESEWPKCPVVGGNCVEYDLATLLGQSVNVILQEFIWNRAEGSRLTLQRNKQGFSVQVTGEVHRSEDQNITGVEQFKEFRRHLDSLKNGTV